MAEVTHSIYDDGSPEFSDGNTDFAVDTYRDESVLSFSMNEVPQPYHDSYNDHLDSLGIDLPREQVAILAQTLYDWLEATE